MVGITAELVEGIEKTLAEASIGVPYLAVTDSVSACRVATPATYKNIRETAEARDYGIQLHSYAYIQ